MKKSLVFAGLAVISTSVLGMIPNDRAGLVPNIPNVVHNAQNGQRANVGPNAQNGQRENARPNVQNVQQNLVQVQLWNALQNAMPNTQNGQRANVGPNAQNGQRANAIPNILNHVPLNNNLMSQLRAWFIAVTSNNLDEMRRLSRRLDIRSRNQNGNTALHLASFNGNLDIVRWILDYSVEPSGIVRFLSAYRNRVDLRNEDIDVLRNGAFSDRLGLVNFENNSGFTPLYMAAQNGHQDVVRYLTEHGADVNRVDYNGQTTVYASAQFGHLDVVRYLAEHGANVNKAMNEGATPVYIAAQNGHQDVVRHLAQHGANVNKARSDGVTPVYMAAQLGYLEIVRCLAQHGANVNKARSDGVTPVYMAAQFGHLDVVRCLAQHGANVNKARSDGVTPVYMAAQFGYLEIVRCLAENKADINKAANNGATPVLVAALNGHQDVVRYLAEHGADVNKATNEGFTPLYLAAQNGHRDIVRYFMEHETARKRKRRAVESEDIQNGISAKKARSGNPIFRDPNVATSSDWNPIEDVYSGNVKRYIFQSTKRNALFPEIVNHLREMGLTDKKISYIINFAKTKNDTKDKKAREFFQSRFGIHLKRYDYLEAQKRTIALLRNLPVIYINRLLGSHSGVIDPTRKCEETVQEDFSNVRSRITTILNDYEREKSIDETEAVRKAVDKLSKNIGFHDWKIRELLELTDEEDTIREIILMRDFYTENEEIKDPAGNERLESKIENARRKNAVSMFINDGQEIWQIADFFGVTRDEIREYITNAGVNLEASQSEDSESHRSSSDASVSSSETQKKKAD